MEQKKTLWIIAAVGVFLLVVLGVPAILHYPSRNPVPAYASISPVEKKTTQGGWTKPAADVEAVAGVLETFDPEVAQSANDINIEAQTRASHGGAMILEGKNYFWSIYYV